MTATAPTLVAPVWDADNQRFLPSGRCPYPDCAEPVPSLPLTQLPAVAWCVHCQRPYEAIRFAPAGTTPLQLNRRPASIHCTYTGQRLNGYSLLDWSEEGGGPGRSYCLHDPLGALFGPPRRERKITPQKRWQRAVLPDAQDSGVSDSVIAVAVLRGQVLAVTLRGWISVLDAFTGEPRVGRPLEWPDGSTDALDPQRSVRYAPACRGTHMVLATAHQAQFRDLQPHLFGTSLSMDFPVKLVAPDRGTQFLGPPLGVDLNENESFFALLQGSVDPQRGFLHATIRCFLPDGREVARCRASEIARPPVFDSFGGQLVWVDRQGAVSVLPVAALAAAPAGTTLQATSSLPDPLVVLEPSERPTLITVPDGQERAELWVSAGQDGRLDLLHTRLEPAVGGEAWSWDRRSLGSNLGALVGFAVGIGSRHPNNVASQLIAVATDRMVSSFQRLGGAISSNAPLQGPEQGLRGSRDIPLLCSAGVVARLQDGLRLDSQGLGWSDAVFQPRCSIEGSYAEPQGMALFGRLVYLGRGLDVVCCQLQVEEEGT